MITTEERPTLVVDPQELTILLEHRGRQLEHWVYQVYGAAINGDKSTLAQGRAAVRDLTTLIDQLLEQLLKLNWEDKPHNEPDEE